MIWRWIQIGCYRERLEAPGVEYAYIGAQPGGTFYAVTSWAGDCGQLSSMDDARQWVERRLPGEGVEP